MKGEKREGKTRMKKGETLILVWMKNRDFL